MIHEVVKVDAKQISDWKKDYMGDKSFWHLGCYTKKAADLLNAVTHWAVARLNPKAFYATHRYTAPGKFAAYDKIGGGLVVKAEPDIVINSLGEVCIHLNHADSLRTYCKKASTDAQYTSAIKEKLAYALKLMWKSESSGTEMKYLLNPAAKADEEKHVATVSFSEYRALYEHLKERKTEKTLKLHGQAAYDSMVGHPVNDQMVVVAIETIDAEISSLNDILKEKLHEVEAEHQEKCKLVNSEYESKANAIRLEFNEKTAELKNQKEMMLQSQIEAV